MNQNPNSKIQDPNPKQKLAIISRIFMKVNRGTRFTWMNIREIIMELMEKINRGTRFIFFINGMSYNLMHWL